MWTHPNKMVWLNTKNRHLLEVARSLLFRSHVPKNLRGEAILTATYLIDRMPSQILKFKTPLQSFPTTYPNSHLVSQIQLRVFGCTTFVHIHSQHRSKLDARSTKCIFLGYSLNKKGYKCYCPITKKSFIPWMSLSLKTNHIIPILQFRGRKMSKNHRIGIGYPS